MSIKVAISHRPAREAGEAISALCRSLWSRSGPDPVLLRRDRARQIAGSLGDRSDLAESMRRLYFESRLSLAACRLEWAQSDIDAVTKVQLLHDAEAGIKMESQLHPDLGGIAFKKRFEVLHITIQQEFLKIQESRQ